MKKLIVIADSHGNLKGIESLRSLVAENDYIVHLGDGAGDMRALMREFPEKVYLCAGNCDFFSPYPTEGVLDVEGVRIFYCHGHKYDVKSHLYALATKAKEKDCAIALYGHTHTALISEVNGVTLINPGSLRGEIKNGGSYCYLIVNGQKFTPVLVGESVY